MLYEETKNLAAAGGAPNLPGWRHQDRATDMPAFFDDKQLFQNKKARLYRAFLWP